MKVLFSADWHLKLNTKNIPNPWATNRYRLMFNQLHEAEKQVDLHIIGGDIFDTVPEMDELDLFYEYIRGCACDVIIYSGNHEALKKHTTFLTYLKNVVQWINPRVRILDDFETIDNIDFIPYNKLKQYNPKDIEFHGTILCTHVRGEIPPHVKPEVPLELFDRWQVVLAGDLHSYDNCQRNILYPGSPVTTSFHRNEVDTGYIVLDTGTLEHTWYKLEVPQLIRKTIKAGDDMPPTPYHHTIYEVEGDLTTLATIEDNGLLDKKISKRSKDVELILDTGLSLEQEAIEYMTYILALPDETIQEIMKEFSEHARNRLQST